jgi:hypothetical protein
LIVDLPITIVIYAITSFGRCDDFAIAHIPLPVDASLRTGSTGIVALIGAIGLLGASGGSGVTMAREIFIN